MSRGWRIELDRDWDVLGPFPVHAREQHFLSPAYPLDPHPQTEYPTSLTHTAYADWSKTTADPNGVIHVAYPSIPWDQIRATEGWAGLQHLSVLRGRLLVCPPFDDNSGPLLRTELLQGAFFTILPPPDSAERKTHVPEWHHGNIYTLERAPIQLVRFPVSPARNGQGTTYEVVVCAPYEIRLFGDPLSYSSPHPILTLNFSVSLQFPHTPTIPSLKIDLHHIRDAPLQHILAHSITPHIVDGTPFGDAVGIGVQCLDFGCWREDGQGYWSVVHARLVPASTHFPASLSVSLLNEDSVRIAPTQARVIPLRLHISPYERIPKDVKQLDIELTCLPYAVQPMDQRTFILRATLPLTHIPLWTYDKHVPIQASYFFAKSMPTIFSVKPPKEAFGDSKGVQKLHNKSDTKNRNGNEPILALHGAGVDILSQSFWADSLPRQKYAWIVMPQGGTAWGLDWHGPSAANAFAAIPALSRILSTSNSGRWVKWGFGADMRVILMGHSNGGQGAWYMASRWPDRVSGVVAAAGYIKSQAYVPWSMSRFAHFVDPSLRAVLDSSLTPDDNDLFLGNLVGMPVLALHGGADDNVPPWQTREQVGILKTWDPNADVTYHEDPGQPHWYFDVLCNDRVQAFLDRVYFSSTFPCSALCATPSHTQGLVDHERKTTNFTLTVSIPAESGSLNGWQIHALMIPGLLGRLRVMSTPDGDVLVRTTNVAVFSLKSGVWPSVCDHCLKTVGFIVDGNRIDLGQKDDPILFAKELHPKPHWKILPCTSDPLPTILRRLCTPPQRLQSILSTHAPLTLLVPSLTHSPELSAALRIAHALQLFHALDAHIVSVPEIEATHRDVPADVDICEGNLVVIGCAESSLIQGWLARAGGTWSYADGAWHLGTTRFDRPSSAILFCQPHPFDAQGLALFLQSTDTSGLERAVRLFPIRTGVLSPDWLVVDGRADTIGAAGVQGAGVYGWTAPDAQDEHDTTVTTTGKWVWNERMSWLD